MDETSRPGRGRPRTLDVDKTLDIAMRAYWRGDPADVSINAICGLAGVSKPALYRAFGGEDGLMRAVLERYAAEVLSELQEILSRDVPLRETLEALARFATEDAKMETGCVFYKMRAGKHRLGPRTQALVAALDAGAVAGFADWLKERRAAGDRAGDRPAETVGRYLVEQIGLALSQRAAGEDSARVRDTFDLAMTPIREG
jgi:AcrR family transcriptional regulator